MQNGSTGEEVVGIPLMNDQKTDLVPDTITSARELALGTTQRVTR
jgi:hypothetical protein